MPIKDRFPIVRDVDGNYASNEYYSINGWEDPPLLMEAHITGHYRLDSGEPSGELSG
jgi:hypothetical protein